MLQFSPSDTTKWVEKYGNYSAGDATLSGLFNNPTTTYVGVQATKTGIVGAATGFEIDDYVLIYQSRNGGDGAGNWQLNRIRDIVGTTFTFKYENQHDFDTTAQIVKINKNRNVTINATFDTSGFNGSVNGIIVLMGRSLTVSGLITGTGRGYRGGAGIGSATGNTGEGNLAASIPNQNTNNGNGGGGGNQDGGNQARGGGGGGNAEVGTDGVGGGGVNPGVGGAVTSTDTFGGGGGGGSRGNGVSGTPGSGGPGGGFILLIFPNIKMIGGGTTRNDGVQGGDATEEGAGGGGGGGGTTVMKAEKIDFGALSTETGGIGGIEGLGGNGSNGGPGGNGRIRAEYANSVIGTTTPEATLIQSNIFYRRRTPAVLMNLANR